MLKPVLTYACLFLIVCTAYAQDPQYSQFYAAPLYLNPAFTGASLAPRITANYRTQWPALDAKFITYSVAFDHYFSNVNSGVGLLVTQDNQGMGRLRSTDIGGLYSYQLQLSEEVAFRAGLQLSYVMRDAGFGDLIFGDQFNAGDRDFTDPTGEIFPGDRVQYFDVSSGGLLYTSQFWLGFSAHHMNRPEQSFFDENSRLPVKYSVHAGYKIPLDDVTRRGLAEDVNAPERSITPAILYKAQGKFDQLDAGLYVTLEPVVFGLWYRGLPIKRYETGLNNNDAAIFLIGFKRNGLSVGYSYDLTISNLGYSTGGAHELSLAYEFPAAADRKRIPRNARKIPCPKF